MSETTLTRFALLPELELLKSFRIGKKSLGILVKKTSLFEVCPGCASKSSTVYDHRQIRVADAPIRNSFVVLLIKKRRFLCKNARCGKVFMEPVKGISKGSRFTQRFKAHILWACEKFTDLKAVKLHARCSYGFIYNALYEQLELNRRKHTAPWPKIIGIDEHAFKRNKKYGHTEFATLLVDHRNRRAIELAEGKSQGELIHQTSYLKGRENVTWVTMDLCQPFRSYVHTMFPKAQIVADKFHVVRLLDNHINRYRKAITGDKRKHPIRKLLLKNSHDLDYWKRSAIYTWLQSYPLLREIYGYKQALHKLYRTKGYKRARTAFHKLLTAMGYSKLPEIRTLRRTLLRWEREILNYFKTRLTNARVEGFNNKAKLIKRKAYGYKSFRNYRLRVLNACC